MADPISTNDTNSRNVASNDQFDDYEMVLDGAGIVLTWCKRMLTGAGSSPARH